MFFTDVPIIFQIRKESIYHFLCCEDAWRKSFCSKDFIGILLLDSLYWWWLSSTTKTRHFGHCKQEKHQIFIQQKTIFLNFYKTKDYFLDLIIKTKDLCAQYSCPWETPEACPQKCSSKRTNTFPEEHRLETASVTFGNVLHYFSAISQFFQNQSPKEILQAVSQMCS